MIIQKKLLSMMSILPVILLASGPIQASAENANLDDLFLYAASLAGTPYHMGGALPETGLDCSGFVRHVYLQTTHVELPRTAVDMSQEGEPVEQTELRPGDLVFFNTLQKPFSHVGIYLGESRFIHASSSKTGRVTISSLQDPYWFDHYDGARRISAAFTASSQP